MRGRELPPASDANDPLLSLEIDERGPQPLVLDPQSLPELSAGEGGLVGEEFDDLFVQGAPVVVLDGSLDLEVDLFLIINDQAEGDGVRRSSRSVFDREHELPLEVAKVPITVPPGPEVPAPSESLTADLRAAFPGVVDEDDGDIEATLKIPEEGEELGDLLGVVFVHAVEPDEGIEKEEPRSLTPYRFEESSPILSIIEPQARGGDDVEVHEGERDAPGPPDGGDPRLQGRERVLGQVDEG